MDNDKFKIITIEEKEPIIRDIVDNDVETGDNETPVETEYRIISTRKFRIRKYSAKTSIKTVKLLSAKLIPLFKTFTEDPDITNKIDALMSGDLSKLPSLLDVDSIAKALDMIDDDDLDKIIDTALRHSFEILKGNDAQILSANGTFGVPDVEDDVVIVMRLTVEAGFFSVSSFFNVSRLGSVLRPLGALFRLNA